jgi:O-antigen/teichoic acid export membrane protein
VIPLVALAYAFNGVYYCLSPGVHIAGRTHYFAGLAVLSAAVNLGLNFLLIPRFGMMGAAWSTVLAFLFLAAATGAVAQRAYPVEYEYARLTKAIAVGALVYVVATSVPPETSALSFAWNLGASLVAFPLLLLSVGFLDERERKQLGRWFRRYAPSFG